MPNPCPGCGKLASLDLQDPEVNDLELDDSGKITGSVRIYRTSSCCNEEMKEATFDLEVDVPERTCCKDGKFESVEDHLSQLEEGGGRYKKSYFGAEGAFALKCSCGQETRVAWTDKIDAASMDEIV